MTGSSGSDVSGLLHTGAYRLVPRRFAELESYLTKDEDLFVLAHVGVPLVDARQWRLRIGGLVERPFDLSYEALQARPGVEVTAFHKCSGNPLEPPLPTPDRVGNVTWTGVRLRDLLSEAGVRSSATYLWAEGADQGTFAGVQVPSYCKDLSIVKSMSDEVLVAYAMNGIPLTALRGGPVRLVVPGYYATNSVKWLNRLTLADQRADGLFTTVYYNEPAEAGSGLQPIWSVAPDCAILTPRQHQRLAGPTVSVTGWAWGEDAIVDVAVTADGGRNWQSATVAKRTGHSWQAFRAEMRILGRTAGPVLARATDRAGRVQPLTGARNAAVPVEIIVA